MSRIFVITRAFIQKADIFEPILYLHIIQSEVLILSFQYFFRVRQFSPTDAPSQPKLMHWTRFQLPKLTLILPIQTLKTVDIVCIVLN